MKSRLVGVILGVCIIGFGILLYPYWVTYVMNPFVDLVKTSLLPDMSAWQKLFFDTLPFTSFFLILFAGTMYIKNKLRGHKEDVSNE